ncbi:MAG: hypothetical protein ACK526_23260, partial [Planctomyces sp.]
PRPDGTPPYISYKPYQRYQPPSSSSLALLVASTLPHFSSAYFLWGIPYDIFGRQVRKMTRSTGFQPTSAADFENDFRYSYDVQGRLITDGKRCQEPFVDNRK